MYGVALFQLANLVGLRQVDIGAHFGITTPQVHHWAKGQRAIPAATLAPLVRLIAQAVARYLVTRETLVTQQPTAPPTTATLWTRADFARLVEACVTENLWHAGYRVAPSLPELARHLDAYSALPSDQQREAGVLGRLLKSTAGVSLLLSLRRDLRPLLALLPEAETPFFHDPKEDDHAHVDRPQ